MATNRLVAVVCAVVVAVVAAIAVVSPHVFSSRPKTKVPDEPLSSSPGREPDRRRAPVLNGTVLDAVSPKARPPVPAQWGGGRTPIPSNTWWSSAVAGPGATSLWPQPLAVTISATGTVSIDAPQREDRADGSRDAPLIPAVVLALPGSATTRVVDEGPLHVTIEMKPATGHPVLLTLVQGSPLIEIHATDDLRLRVTGIQVDQSDTPSHKGRSFLRFGTARGPWLLASAGKAQVAADGDGMTVTPGSSGALVLGPVPKGSGASYVEQARAMARHRLVSTAERLEVAPDGTTTQILSQTRRGDTDGTDGSLWALQPHHQRFGVDLGATLGTVPSALGPVPVVAGNELRLVYPAVPVLWSAVPVPGGPKPGPVKPIEVEGRGSYFGGKAAYAFAARGDALAAAGRDKDATKATDDAVKLLDQLLEPGVAPVLRWDERWGSAVIEPAELGAGTELNDHQLQYGYWVAAASHIADVDPEAAGRYHDLVDLLVADYAGASTVPGAPSSLPANRTWSPYEGHSWASGTEPFAAGNNLESISESSLAWWAAARWFLSTDRPAVAATFVARFTIESALTGYQWLPQGDQLPDEASQRPWSGVVWSGKSDPGTFFDHTDESALGIRLLPVGPAGLARYGSTAAIDAAHTRWDWCDRYGDGCTKRWANLLDSDAVVAGRPPLQGPTPEPSVTEEVAGWWRDLWTRTDAVQGWSCSVGAVPRRLSDGTVVILAANPGPEPVAMTCRDDTGTERWSARVTRTLARPVPAAG